MEVHLYHWRDDGEIAECYSVYLVADGRVTVHHHWIAAVHADHRRALGQGHGVLLFFPLPHDGLAAQPLAHRLLVARSYLLVYLQR